MAAERVDYYSDDEYRQAVYAEEQEYYYRLQEQAAIEAAIIEQGRQMNDRKEKAKELKLQLIDTLPREELNGPYEELYERFESMYDRAYTIAMKAIQLLEADD